MDAAAQGSVERWQFNNGGFGPGPVRPPVMGLFLILIVCCSIL